MTRLLVDVSSHGLGHLGQTAPVLNALGAAIADLEITVRSGVPLERLKQRISIPFNHIQAATDFGFVMHNAIDIDMAATAQRYREFHQDWNARVAKEAAWLTGQRFDAVLSNIAYLPLAGAARAGIPAVAMSAINWADLVEDSFDSEGWSQSIVREMRSAYASAEIFVRVTPGLPMGAFDNARTVGPICQIRKADRLSVAQRLGIDSCERWLLVDMGGIDFPIDLKRWPSLAGARYLVPPSLRAARSDVTVFDTSIVDFIELLASVDVLLTKPGYGNFVEAACHGRPVLYLRRPHWAEEPFLIEWLHQNTQAQAIERQTLMQGDLARPLEALLGQPLRPVPAPSGIAQALQHIDAVVSRG